VKRISAAIGIAALISTGSCIPFGGLPSGGRPVMDVHDGADNSNDTLRIVPGGAPLAPDVSIPVIHPPEVFPVWVPSHVDIERDLMVGGHYLFIKLRDSSWLADRMVDDDPPSSAVTPEEELRAMKGAVPSASWDRALVPFRRDK